MRHITEKHTVIWMLIGVYSSVYGQDKKFEKAVNDYYNFQYVSSINGFESFLERDDLIGIRANYYTAMSFFNMATHQRAWTMLYIH